MRKVILLSMLGLILTVSQAGCSMAGGCGCGGEDPKAGSTCKKEGCSSCGHAKGGCEKCQHAKDSGETCGMAK